MSRFDATVEQARNGRLYPASILYGASLEQRQDAALTLARSLLCEKAPEERPCGSCHHCRRIAWPIEERLHPDLHILERDLRTATSIDATKRFLQSAWSSPFEARGQVFVVAEANSLGAGAADSLLKILEEPPTQTPRNFLLLAPSRLALLPTLRSRSLEVYLGASESLDPASLEDLSGRIQPLLEEFFTTGAAVLLLAIADVLQSTPGWEDPRAAKPWALSAAALARVADTQEGPCRRALLELAEALLDAGRMRLRGIQAGRILEGLLCRHLAAPRAI